MALIISHNSALEYLRAVPPQVRGDNRVWDPVPIEGTPGPPDLFQLTNLGLQQRPLHLLTALPTARCRARGVISHRTSLEHVPPGLLLKVTDDLYACGPELVFLQLATSVSKLGLVVLGYELCGSYSHFAPLVSGFYDRPALTTKEKIGLALDELGRTHGTRIARGALDLVLEGSASPMETVTSNMLFLPARMGGLGLVMPQLNCKVPLDDVAQRIAGTRFCVADGLWSELGRGFEYNGGDHTDPIRDRNRLEALAHEGFTMYTIDADRMMRFSELKKVCDLIRADVPRRAGQGDPSEEEMRRLHRRLLAATRCDLGMDAALFGVPVDGAGIRVHL